MSGEDGRRRVRQIGLVFGYMGPAENKPVLPRYECLERMDDGEFVRSDWCSATWDRQRTSQSCRVMNVWRGWTTASSSDRTGVRLHGTGREQASPAAL